MTLHLFEGYGIELEYMIVDRETLDVRPIADEVFLAETGNYSGEAERGDIAWSNELALHVIELKTNGPAASLQGLAPLFHQNVLAIDELLRPHNARLMPTAMHPWMHPDRESRLWPHDYNAVYKAFDRIFDCSGHGWSNLQSMHVNLPFDGDDELGRLHAAIRLVLPLIPALAASSPVVEGSLTGLLDTRLDRYRLNCRRIPSVTGRIIPEPVFTADEYEKEILQSMYRDIAPHDPEKILQEEWLNARGAIVRFDRNAIEIRVIDIQECPAADLAIATLISETIRALVAERWSSWEEQKRASIDLLEPVLLDTMRRGDEAIIDSRDYLALFGVEEEQTAIDVWRHIGRELGEHSEIIEQILTEGPLSRRLLRALGNGSDGERIREVYRQLCDCLTVNRIFSCHR